MIKAEKFQEQVEGILKDRQDVKRRKIDKDVKLVEDALEDLYIKIERARELNIEIPKYTIVDKILEKEVSDDLILNQGFLLEITNDKHTRIYYNKKDFDDRVKYNKKIDKVTFNKDAYSTKEQLNNKQNSLKTPHTKEEFEENITKLLKNILGDKTNDIKIMKY